MARRTEDQQRLRFWINRCELIGIVAGALLAAVCGFLGYLEYPDDPGVGAAAVIFGFVTVPAGFVAGAIVGRIIARME